MKKVTPIVVVASGLLLLGLRTWVTQIPVWLAPAILVIGGGWLLYDHFK